MCIVLGRGLFGRSRVRAMWALPVALVFPSPSISYSTSIPEIDKQFKTRRQRPITAQSSPQPCTRLN
ncbi:hypothetical protein CC2G_011970 [Coprinopsis cinerea AmutBmut pab1-1]|nr:hypothetical protein CC2G_011970 [Coprinopsis cinerea AmutBmut pab1-1]